MKTRIYAASAVEGLTAWHLQPVCAVTPGITLIFHFNTHKNHLSIVSSKLLSYCQEFEDHSKG